MPVTIEILLKDGSKQRVHLPAETWLMNHIYTLPLKINQSPVTVTLDPDAMLPDTNRSNNVWNAGK